MDSPHVSQVAQAAVVPEAAVPVGGHSPDPLPEEGPDSSGGEISSDGDHPDAEPDCMATLIQVYREAGLSEEATAMTEKAR